MRRTLRQVRGLGRNTSTASGSGTTSGNIYGAVAQGWANGTNSGAIAERVYGLIGESRNRSPGTVATATGLHGNIGIENGGSGAGTITNAYFGRFRGTSESGIPTLVAGTITNAIGVQIGDWSSGPTYTNAPVALDLVAQTASGAIALRTGTGKVELGDKVTKYNAITTVSNGVPSIVAEASGATQAAAVGTTTLYTPTSSGLFRINVYLQITQAGTTSTLGGLTLTYTEPDASIAQTTALMFGNAGICKIN